ncbi:MAG: nicotinate (nicotinamide) nucleotide adenylyltransferase [Alphaproteobacteria bacterium]|nr:nicotinate (nicotinamide) nucleotide adenylyltransferase [Alphaproteobacteria bacterium]
MSETVSRRKIGLFGGSFDPVHEGHEHVCRVAREKLGLDAVWVLVSPQNPLKKNKSTELHHRLAMCNLMTAPHADWLKVVDETPYYTSQTIDTLDALRAEYPDVDFVWIMGADNLVHFHEWARWQEIIDNHAIAIISRPGEGEQANESEAARHAASIRTDNADDLFKAHRGWYLIENELCEFESRKIRHAWRTGERNIKGLPQAVENYMVQNGLYPDNPPASPPAPPQI